MTIDLAGLVADQEELMADQCVLSRNPGGAADDTIDPVTLQLIPSGATSVFTGYCEIRFQPARRAIGQANPSEDAAVPGGFLVKLPLTKLTLEPEPGDRLLCTASVNDPGLAGRTFTITRVQRDTYSTARLCELETSWASS